MENLYDTIDITSENFVAMLPIIGEAIENCDFIAFDLEFSGKDVETYHKSVRADTLETRYAKAKANVDTFYPLQIGLCFFKWSNKRQSWTCKPFNFYLRPYTHKYLQSHITFNSFTVSFLHENHFDFNKALSSGIYTLRYSDEESILKLMSEESEYQEYKDDNDYNFVQNFLQSVNSWVLKMKEKATTMCIEFFLNSYSLDPIQEDQQLEDEDNLISPNVLHQPHVEVEGIDYIFTPQCPYHTRKLIKQEIEARYPKLFVCERAEDNIGVKSKYYRWRIYRHQYTRDLDTIPKRSPLLKIPSASLHTNYQQGTPLEKDPGMRRVLELLIVNKKPLVGFECLLDITFTFGSMYDYLPDHLKDFILFLHQRIPTLVDLKMILDKPEMIEYFTDICSLVSAYHIVSTHEDFKSPHIGMYSESSTIVPHDASNDAYMTGYLFIKLATYYGLTFQDIRNTMKRTNDGTENIWTPTYTTQCPSNSKEVPIQPEVFTSTYNHIHLHRFDASISLYIDEYEKITELMDRRKVLLLSKLPNYYNRDLLRKLFNSNGIKDSKSILFEWLDTQYALASFPSVESAQNAFSIWKESISQIQTEGSTKGFTFNQLQMDDYSVYEKMCYVSKDIVEKHKQVYKLD